MAEFIPAKEELTSKAIKVTLNDPKTKKPVARAFVYLIKNELHDAPYGLLEDVYVLEECRGKGLGKKIVRHAIDAAKQAGCYKLIATARYSKGWLVPFYEGLGFKKWGTEFRMDF